MATTLADSFILAVEQATVSQQSRLLYNWMPQSVFTSYFRETFITSIAKSLDLSCACEHRFMSQRIDYVLYGESDTSGGSFHIKPLIAVEHENNVTENESEVIKLAQFDAPLKVLFTYISDRKINSKLLEFNNILDKKNSPEKSSFLLVVGPYGFAVPNVLTWTFYLYESGPLVKLNRL